MAHLAPNSIDIPKSSGTRSHKKCDRCRRDHQKCLPENRRWNEEQEPCSRCKKHDYECGPSAISPRKRKRMSQPSFSSDSDEPDTHLGVGTASTIENSPSARNDATLSVLGLSREGNRTQPLNSSASAGHLEDNSHAPSNETGQRLPPTGRKRCEMRCRLLLKELGDLKALHRIIVLSLDELNELDLRIRPCAILTDLESTFEAWISAIDEMTTKLIDEGSNLLLSDKGSYTECFLSRLDRFMDDLLARNQARHVNWAEPKQSTVNEAVRLKKIIHEAVYRSRKRKEIYSEAEIICDALGGHPKFLRRPSLGSEAETDTAYLRAAGDIQHMCSKLGIGMSQSQVLPKTSLAFMSIQRGCPAPLLAYRVCDRWSALRLWSDSASQTAYDMMHRTLLHHAVGAGDVMFVREIAKINSEIIKHTGTDALGMSLLALATVRNDKIMFDILLESGAICCSTDTDTGVLALAARLGNTAIIRQMLTRQPCLPNLGKALHRAIEGRHEKPAQLILECMVNQARYDEKELEGAAEKAEWCSLNDLAAQIRNVVPFFGTPSQALEDVDSASFENLLCTGNSRSFLPMIPTNQWYSRTLLAEEVTPQVARHVVTPYSPAPGSARMNDIPFTQLDQQQSVPEGSFHENSDLSQ